MNDILGFSISDKQVCDTLKDTYPRTLAVITLLQIKILSSFVKHLSSYLV